MLQQENRNAVPGPNAKERRPGEGRWRLTVFAAPDDRDALLRELRRCLAFNPIDARIALHSLPGILPEWLTADQARRAAAAIRSLGIEAAAFPESKLPQLSPTNTVHRVDLTERGLEVVGATGKIVDRIEWDRISVISIADVPLDLVRRYVADRTSVWAAPHSKPLVTDEATQSGAEMWIICANPDHALRIDHREMNYAGLGDAKGDSATVNFRRFAERLVRGARDAWLTPSAHAFLTRAPAERYRFNSQQAHVDATTLHTLLVKHIGDQAAADRAKATANGMRKAGVSELLDAGPEEGGQPPKAQAKCRS